MKIGAIIDLVLLSINGGSLNAESAFWEVDVYAYLPAAINAAIRDDKEAQEQNRRTNSRAGFLPVSSSASNIQYSAYTVTPVKDDNDLYYADLPGSLLFALPNAGVESVYPPGNPTLSYPRANNLETLSGLGHVVENQPWWWVEGNENASRLRFLWLPNTSDISVRAAILPADMDMDAEAPIPVGMEDAVIETCKKHFLGERTTPADSTINQQDINADAQVQQNN
jgi:hypothetical protein